MDFFLVGLFLAVKEEAALAGIELVDFEGLFDLAGSDGAALLGSEASGYAGGLGSGAVDWLEGFDELDDVVGVVAVLVVHRVLRISGLEEYNSGETLDAILVSDLLVCTGVDFGDYYVVTGAGVGHEVFVDLVVVLHQLVAVGAVISVEV